MTDDLVAAAVGALVALVLGMGILFQPACSPSWPGACARAVLDDGRRVVVCRCKTFVHEIVPMPGEPHPAGVERMLCDGEALPIEVRAREVKLPCP